MDDDLIIVVHLDPILLTNHQVILGGMIQL